ncbi:Do family serine endopeptidase [Bacteroidetes/Chlorobi group bacterium ChocPot_Mid]|jgi:serine protease Do|nr:MAG: Do family serine endopeptidase [Bacteroidetes/Chlorobi group bacterium ChocPot_Mid]
MKRNILAAIGLLGVGITLGVWLVLTFGSNSGLGLFANEKIGADKPPVVMSPTIKALNDAMVSVSEAVLPTVVSVNVVVEEKNFSSPFRDQWKEFFEFFGDAPFKDDSPRRAEATGSGVLISKSGYIVTNNHVIENAKEITVTTYDKKKYKAKLVGADPLTDLAVIKIDEGDYPIAHFADINNVKIGEMVIAVGNPLGLNSTVTSGIVSAIGRGGLGLPRQESGGYQVENFIQTDAAINPGNSGGGLFNLEGSLVGINSAIATRTGSYIGYGFAIPVDLVKSVIEDLIDDGKIDRGYIGVRIRTIDETDAKAVGLDVVEGVMVHDVIKDGAADKAGIESGDVILEIDGKKVATSNELQSQIVLRRAGDKVKLTIWRDKKKITKEVKLLPKDDDETEVAVKSDKNKEKSNDKEESEVKFDDLGFTVTPLNKEAKESLSVKSGALITGVERYSEASQRGLSPNGVIVKADGKEVNSPSDLKKIISSKKPGDGVLLHIKYKDSNRIVAIAIPEKK